jgi:hypothetical protein
VFKEGFLLEVNHFTVMEYRDMFLQKLGIQYSMYPMVQSCADRVPDASIEES